MLDYYWHRGRWKLSSEPPAALRVNSEAGPAAPIAFHPPTEATVAVGLAQVLTGSMDAQFKILETKISQWQLALARGKLPRGLSWRGFRSMIWPSL